MSLSEILSKAARAEAERKHQLEAAAQSVAEKAQKKQLWEAFNTVCEFVPRGSAELAARTWAALLMVACAQLKTACEIGRLEAMRYTGTDRLRMAGMEAAFHVCRLACVGEQAEVRTAFQTLIASAHDLDSPFRLFLECVRDNRRWWSTDRDPGR